jgi:hypothetical protein
MSSSKKVIYFDSGLHQNEEARQLKMQALFNSMLEEAEKASIKVDDFRAFIKDPIEYCANSYWDANSKFFPAGITKDKAIQGTGFDSIKVSRILSEYRHLENICKGLKVNKNSVSLTVSKDDYNWYLSDDKKKKYEALEKFLQAVEEVEKYSVLNHYFIQRAVGFDCFLINDVSRLKINHNTFR